MDDLKTIGALIALIILILGLLFGVIGCENNRMTNNYYGTINSYTMFVVNGETYNTQDIEKIEYFSPIYGNDSITFYMKNGDRVEGLASSISWKGKK